MCQAQAHRGPDQHGTFEAEGIALGIQRLRVIDLDSGDQPIYNEDRSIVVVLNGEIYNHPELRDRLSALGHAFSTSSDTEVIVHLYEEHGDDCVHHLSGMFAFALWDARASRLLIARDRVGKKPLHYHHFPDGSLSFASELQALMKDRSIPRSIDPSSLDSYLAFGYTGAPHTIYRGVRKLQPAHRMVWESGRVSSDRWWQPEYLPKHTEGVEQLGAMVREVVGNAVERRMLADVPVGAFLSGGIDSSIVVAEMARRSTRPVKTFSIGFDDEELNELPMARLVASQFDTDHVELTVKPDAIEALPSIVRHHGEPYGDSSAIPSLYLSELASGQVTVALNGDGGDESFGGYIRYPANAHSAWIDRIPRSIRRSVSGPVRAIVRQRERGGARVRGRRYLTTFDQSAPQRYAAHVGIFSAAERRDLLAPEVLHAVDPGRTSNVIGAPWQEGSDLGPLDRILYTDLLTYLPGDLLAKMDIASMTHSLEARSPLLDHEVIGFAARLPAKFKVRGTQKKWLLRNAYRERLPDAVLDGRKKGFGVPVGKWLRGELREWSEELLLGGQGDDLINRRATESLLKQHASGNDRTHQIWALLCLHAWCLEAR